MVNNQKECKMCMLLGDSPTQELRQELYRELVNTNYNSESEQKKFLVSLGSIWVSLSALFFVILNLVLKNKLEISLFEWQYVGVYFIIAIGGLAIYIIIDLPSGRRQQKKKNDTLKELRSAIAECNKAIEKAQKDKVEFTCKGGEVKFSC